MKNPGGKGFTLMELMVVIGIITIVGVVIAPRLKKAYEDFYVRKTLDETDTFIKSYRSYYLIYNQVAIDAGAQLIPNDVATFVPSCYLDKKETESFAEITQYYLTSSPYGVSGLMYDFQSWIHMQDNGDRVFFAIGGVQGQWLNFYLEKCRKIYSTSTVKIFGNDVLIGYPEIPKGQNLDSICKNRWY